MKNRRLIILSVFVTVLFLFLAYGSGDSDDKKETKQAIDCSKNKSAYEEGYAAGELCKTMGDYSSCESFVSDCNYKTGRDILVASDCYCEGFEDGQNGVPEKYK